MLSVFDNIGNGYFSNILNFSFFSLFVSSHQKGFQTFFYISCAMYLFYLALLILKAYSELRSMPFFGKLDRLILLYQFFVSL